MVGEMDSPQSSDSRMRTGREDLVNDKVVLITGGTGSFGHECTRVLLGDYRPRKLIIFSRDELKQHDMRALYPDTGDTPMRYFIGDVRDRDRLRRAFTGVDLVVHAAALKQVPACEYNPIEAIMTNVMGARNVVDAALDAGVKKVIALSTDKAVNPVNLYGATKLCAEKLIVQSNAYSGETGTRFSCVRYGNVMGSRGSVVPLFERQRESGRISVTDARMTRFWLTLEQGVRFVLRSIGMMQGGEVFVPKIPSVRLMDLAAAVAPDSEIDVVGIRPGEKLHEALISPDEAGTTVSLDGMFVIQPAHTWWRSSHFSEATPMADGFSFTSDANDRWLTVDEIRRMLEEP